jgi:DNA topoisomerase-2
MASTIKNTSSVMTSSVTTTSSKIKSPKNTTPKNTEEMDKELAQTYQMKSDKQHVLDSPDTYTGSMELTDYDTFIYDEESKTIVAKHITIIPGLYKLFDEGIVNCRDHCVRMAQTISGGNADAIPVTSIQIDITPDGTITMTNDGNGIDVAKHPEEDIWIPEMIFGHLRTSTNYDKTQKKITGGKNGFGFKLVLIWSTWGKIETIDHTRGLKYTQEFTDNLNTIHPPKITKCTTKKPYTTVSFKPDYKRLGLGSGLTADMMSLFKRRVYDVAAITDKTVKVKYNSELVPIKNFQQYVDLYIGGKGDTKRIYEDEDSKCDRWEYAVCLAPKEEFTQVSFVNGIYTGKGGKHVDYILNQIVRKVSAYIKQKKKVDVKPNTIKEQLWLFVRCDIDNPAFDSQTKDFMNTPVASFGSSCEVSDKFIEKVAKMGVMDAACALTEVKENKALKKTDGTKSKSIRGIPKLIDANFAGTDKSNECTLILCEGDSAKAGIVSGLSTSDRNIIGVYPLKGKLFNVRGEATKRIMENKEILELRQIMGLEIGKKYTEDSVKKTMRYGKVLFMTDQDLDGSHIKGLCINLFDSEWSSLLSISGFMGFMNTPIIKAHKGNKELLFYSDGEYEKWKVDVGDAVKGWKCKYYKGLGTSTSKEFKEYFANKKTVEFVSSGEKSRDSIDMAFNKKRANDRKDWLVAYNRNEFLDTSKKNVTYEEFIEKEMIHFSKYDCERSIPNIDGLKTSQRKVLYTCFKRRITSEIKVAQLSGSVSELSRYHHGEQSLNGTIVNMAQNFVGSNNINLLEPNGQFGTRLQGGDDSASERYIYTQLNPLTRYIFPEADDVVLTSLEDDGHPVEPMYYVPIVPLLLINGSKGIGTGFSTEILCYNPISIIDYMCEKINGGDSSKVSIMPYYEGFKGTITSINETKFLFKGKYEVLNDKQVRVTELPIGTWTDDYKQFIEDLIDGDKQSKKDGKDEGKESKKKTVSCGIKDYTDMSTDTSVDITITFAPGIVPGLISDIGENECNGLEKLLKLYTTKSTTNMHAFDENEKLLKFETILDLIDHYMKVRMNYYIKRKAYQLLSLSKEASALSNKARFICEVLEDTLDLRKKKTSVVSAILKEKGYDIIDDDEDYKYLVKLPMDSVTEENVTKIMSERDRKLGELEALKSTAEKDIWLNELGLLKSEYIKCKAIKQDDIASSSSTKKLVVKKKKLLAVTE